MDKFWKIIYEDGFCDEEEKMKFAYIIWDWTNDEHDTLIENDLNEYNNFRPVSSLGWINELINHIGEDYYIYNIKYKGNGEIYIFYREKCLKTKHEEDVERMLRTKEYI